MSSSDVRAILNLPQGVPGPSTITARRPQSSVRRPDGISRELYALIGNNAPSLAEAQASLSAVKYKDRLKPNRKRAKWEWTEFCPMARQENAVSLRHWVRVTDDDPLRAVDYFGSFSRCGPSLMEYSQYEYDQHLGDSNWTFHETGYLFDILRTYDLRFVIAADRYAYRGPDGTAQPTVRTVEEMKDRYYTICRRLIRTRTATDPQAQQQMIQAHSFDRGRETRRKQYASELFHLTAAEIAEEEALYVELQRMEQNARRYRAERDELMRTVMGLDSGLIDLDQDSAEIILGVDKSKKRKRPEEIEAGPQSPSSPMPKKQKEGGHDAVLCIYRTPASVHELSASHLAAKHPPHVAVHVRSSKLPLPRPTASILITEVLNELGVSTARLVMPTRPNIELYESVLGAASALVDMKRQVDRVEQETRSLRLQKDGFVAPFRNLKRSESVTSTETSGTNRRSRQG